MRTLAPVPRTICPLFCFASKRARPGVDVPYRDGGFITDALSGQVKVMFMNLPACLTSSPARYGRWSSRASIAIHPCRTCR